METGRRVTYASGRKSPTEGRSLTPKRRMSNQASFAGASGFREFVQLAMQDGSLLKMSGTCEADEMFVGGKAGNKHKFARATRIRGRGAVGKSRVPNQNPSVQFFSTLLDSVGNSPNTTQPIADALHGSPCRSFTQLEF